jgi:hypothetical protein
MAAPGAGWRRLSPPWKFFKVRVTSFSIGAKSELGWAEPTREEIPGAAATLGGYNGKVAVNFISIWYAPPLYISESGSIRPRITRSFEAAALVAYSASSLISSISDLSSINFGCVVAFFNNLSLFIFVHSCLFNLLSPTKIERA